MFSLLATLLVARPQTISIGDRMPPLRVQRWVKGSPITGFRRGKVYVIELWAVWCGPCVAGMPHLTRLQKRFGDKVGVIGIASPDDYGDTLDAVETLVKRKGGQIGYRIAWDRPGPTKYLGIFRGASTVTYMQGAGVQAFPVAFVVDRLGKIAYIGHPAAIDSVVDQVMRGRWDLGAAALRRKEQLVAEGQIVHFESLLKANRFEDAYRLGAKIAAGAARYDPRLMTWLASDIVGSDAGPARRDLPLAEKCALTAVHLTGRKEPGMLDALACVYYRKGDFERAIATEREAIALSEGDFRAAQKRNLEKYRKAGGTYKGANG